MWVYSRIGFISAVSDKTKSEHVLIRTRCKRDADQIHLTLLELDYPCPPMEKTPNADYLYRISVPLDVWNTLVSHLSMSVMEYINFKDDVSKNTNTSDEWYEHYTEVFTSAMATQRKDPLGYYKKKDLSDGH